MKKLTIVLLVVSLVFVCSCGSKKSKEEPAIFDFTEEHYGNIETGDLKALHGELISVIQNGNNVVVKTKIESSWNNDLTIKQNYFTVSDLIKNHGFNTCNELQYWAIADMTSGMESKVISFTLDKKTIDKIYAGTILDNEIGDYSSDLWILPSLRQ